MARPQSSLRDSVSYWCHIPSDKSLGYYRMPLRGMKASLLVEMCRPKRSTDVKHILGRTVWGIRFLVPVVARPGARLVAAAWDFE